jgi:Flp pilus assembly protein TadG
MAVVTPLLLTMLFGIIEFGWLFTVRSTLVNAAREGARLGALPDVPVSEIQDRTREGLVAMNLDDNCSVTVTEPTEENPIVTVRVTVPRCGRLSRFRAASARTGSFRASRQTAEFSIGRRKRIGETRPPSRLRF